MLEKLYMFSQTRLCSGYLMDFVNPGSIEPQAPQSSLQVIKLPIVKDRQASNIFK